MKPADKPEDKEMAEVTATSTAKSRRAHVGYVRNLKRQAALVREVRQMLDQPQA